MKRIYIAFLVITGLSMLSVNAQDHLVTMQYSVGFGMGKTHDYISEPSFRGVTLDYYKFITANHAIGFEVSYNLFYERKDYATYTNDNESLSGVQFRYLHSLPLLASYDYFFKPSEKYNPFAGVGLGCNVLTQRLDMGIYTFSNDAVQFTFRPEAGVLMKVNPNLDVIFAAKYYVCTKGNDMDGQSYLALNLGFAF